MVFSGASCLIPNVRRDSGTKSFLTAEARRTRSKEFLIRNYSELCELCVSVVNHHYCPLALWLLFQSAQYFFRCNRQVEKMMTHRTADRVANGRAGRRYGGLADAVHVGDAVGLE